MTSLIAFDLDGTLIDSAAHIHQSVALALDEMNLPPVTQEETKGFVGRGLPVLLQRLLDHIDHPQSLHADLSRHVMHHYVNLPSDPATIYPGVLTALDTLRDQGITLTICTNKPGEATLSALRDTGLAGYFDRVIAGDSLPTRKPSPEMLHAAVEGGSRVLYVGDSEVDAETAQHANLPFLLYTEGYRKTPVDQLPHTASFSDFADLTTLVARHL